MPVVLFGGIWNKKATTIMTCEATYDTTILLCQPKHGRIALVSGGANMSILPNITSNQCPIEIFRATICNRRMNAFARI
jgi:hypothetical protein